MSIRNSTANHTPNTRKSGTTRAKKTGTVARQEQPTTESRSLFETIFHANPSAMVLSRLSDGCFVDVNAPFLRLTGYTRDDVIGSNGRQLGIVRDSKAAEQRLLALKQGRQLPDFEVELVTKAGHVRSGLATVGTVSIDGAQLVLTTFIDITERKHAERQLAQMKRLYATLSQVNHIITRASGRGELFQSTCDIAVEYGGFTAAWVGLVDETTGDLRPMAGNGIDVANWPYPLVNLRHGELMDGLSATAIRSSRVVTSEDIQTDRRTQVLHEQFLETDYHSSAGVPLKLSGKPIGVLCLISAELGLFKETEEINLLEEMGLDISFALDAMELGAERKKAEATRDRLAAIVDASEDAILSKSLAGQINSWNAGAERLYGYTAQEAIGQPISMLMPFERRNEMRHILEHIRRGEHIDHYETLRQCKDGRKIWVAITVSPILDEGGSVVGASTIARDISERKRAEEKLRASEAALSLFVEFAPAAIAMFDREMRYIAASRRYLSDYRLGEQDIIGRSHYEIFPELPARWKEVHKRCLAGAVEKADEDAFPREDGSLDWVRWEVRPWYQTAGEIGGLLLFSELVTQHKLAREALQKSEQEYRLISENSADVIWRLDLATSRFTYVSPSVFNLRGLTPEEVMAQPMSAAITAASLEYITRNLPGRIAAFQAGDLSARTATTEVEQLHKDGSIIPTEVVTTLITDAAGRSVEVLGVTRDIRERKRAEEQRQQGEKLLRQIIDLVPHFIFAKDINMRFILANQAVADTYGTTVAELVGKTDADFAKSEQEVEQFKTKDLEVIQSGMPLTIPEEQITDAHGQVHLLQTVKIPFQFSKSQLGILGVSVDITERKQAEQAIRESERQMNALVTSLDDLVFELDEDGTYLNAWAANEELLAQPKAQLLGHNIIEILGESQGRVLVDALKRVLTSGQSESIEYPLDVMGKACWFVARINRVAGQDQSRQTASMLIREITEQKRAAERIQHQLEHLNSLREIDTVISSSFEMKFSLEAIVSRSIRELKVDAADILVLDPGSGMLEYQAGQGFRSGGQQNYQLKIGEGLPGRCLIDRKPVHYADLRAHTESVIRKGLLHEEKFIGYYCLPLINKRELKGVMEVFQRSALEPDQEWVDFLYTLAGQAAIAIESASLFEGLQRSNIELALAYDETIEGWSRALDLRDKETEGHTQRVTELTILLARTAGFKGNELQHIRRGALLHDIGKLGVPDEILLKPGPLTEDEWAIMRRHPQFAHDLIFPILYLKPALDIPYCHHEKWDGNGYPRGLRGDQIPLAARLFAVVDVWDALRHDRPYRQGWPAQKVLDHIRSLAGSHFDPQCVEWFLQVMRDQSPEAY